MYKPGTGFPDRLDKFLDFKLYSTEIKKGLLMSPKQAWLMPEKSVLKVYWLPQTWREYQICGYFQI